MLNVIDEFTHECDCGAGLSRMHDPSASQSLPRVLLDEASGANWQPDPVLCARTCSMQAQRLLGRYTHTLFPCSDPMNPSTSSRRLTWVRVLMIVALAVASIVAVPSIREAVLRTAGWALVVNEPVGSVDIIVLSLHSGGAGALEAADLVQSGVATRVAVFSDPPSGEDHEFIRRGLPYEDASARQIRQLKSLGVTDVMEIPRTDAGTEGEAQVLPPWCDQYQFRSIVFVASRDHSRRLRRVLDRVMRGRPTHVTIRPERYSSFDPDRWWETRGGIRTEILEFQKLVLDIILHPMSF